MRRVTVALALLLALSGVAGCASVPGSSPVQILRRVTEGETAVLPPGPVDGTDAGGLVRGFVEASASSTDDYGAARQFLAPEAQQWDAGAGFTVLEPQFDTVPAPGASDPSTDVTRIRIRGTSVGRVTSSGSFEPAPAPVQIDVTVVRRDGQWRISELPDGVVVPLDEFRTHYRGVRTWFVDPSRPVVVPDLRYLPSFPSRAQAARVMELLLAGPSGALLGAVGSQLAAGARLRSNVALSETGALVVDLTRVGDLDEPGRRLLAAQVVLSLAEVNVARVQLLVDGIPLLPERPVLSREDVADLSGDTQPGADVPALVAAGGRLRELGAAAAELPGPVGNGGFDVESAASTVDGQRLAAVARSAGRRLLLVGGGAEAGVSEVGLGAADMSRPSWTPTGSEVWTVLDQTTVARVLVDGSGPPRTGQVNADELAAFGPIQDLRLSRDGMRVVAVVAGGLYTAAVTRGIDGEVAVRNIRRLRPDDLGEVVSADWRSAEAVVAITRRPDRLVAQVSVDGLSVQGLLVNNLTPPLGAVAAAPSRPFLVTDQSGVWSFAGGDQDAWRQVLGAAPDAVPFYPG
ncbi:LpqB family beta-propeller domain-containing protein [Pseudonocardia hydrocarbonoxydans]|uniref:Lipoprotein n=1 Tax=Pseudonocardia hydrocarbonoxydans TaxID=76726 RepID=A0A4Y3WSS4_9PSEU|nr:LpqB family beta-propeller domain-containing protein [Pseudonocardia hydrocarbonoxydans]GEC21922.1 lipoprotein [Pseudonocardia hydrocarbonoxydans]